LNSWKNRPFAARLGCALRGFAQALGSERSLKLQLLTLAAVVAALLKLRPGPVWWALVLASSATVLAAELLNSALEQLADALHPTQSAAIGQVKDCAAAAVLIASLGAVAVAVALAVHLLGRGG
jgi:diacylglycerol kinase (ATP)